MLSKHVHSAQIPDTPNKNQHHVHTIRALTLKTLQRLGKMNESSHLAEALALPFAGPSKRIPTEEGDT